MQLAQQSHNTDVLSYPSNGQVVGCWELNIGAFLFSFLATLKDLPKTKWNTLIFFYCPLFLCSSVQAGGSKTFKWRSHCTAQPIKLCDNDWLMFSRRIVLIVLQRSDNLLWKRIRRRGTAWYQSARSRKISLITRDAGFAVGWRAKLGLLRQAAEGRMCQRREGKRCLSEEAMWGGWNPVSHCAANWGKKMGK